MLLMLAVGFHRYVIENFTGKTLEDVKEREVQEFDPPSEVRISFEYWDPTFIFFSVILSCSS